jgi:hypothetical protein
MGTGDNDNDTGGFGELGCFKSVPKIMVTTLYNGPHSYLKL